MLLADAVVVEAEGFVETCVSVYEKAGICSANYFFSVEFVGYSSSCSKITLRLVRLLFVEFDGYASLSLTVAGQQETIVRSRILPYICL